MTREGRGDKESRGSVGETAIKRESSRVERWDTRARPRGQA
jgi:hypothetical protein